jgi:hypothetical protein
VDGNYQLTGRHLFIAGTGRAGTSFLVRFLAELGFDTHLSRKADSPSWDENANAGLEDAPFLTENEDLPYVIKSPWLYAYIDALIRSGTFRADAVVIPVRDLAEAAISRSVVERRAIHQNAAWMSELNPSWEQWGHVPGGIIYSLNPVDQGRLLAVGFHHLVQRLVAADIPIIFVAFPRLAEDSGYLLDKLRPLLAPEVGEAMFRAAHARVADESKIRVSGEIHFTSCRIQPHFANVVGYPSHDELDAIALRRELGRLRLQISGLQQETSSLAHLARLRSVTIDEQEDQHRRVLEAFEIAHSKATAEQRQAREERDAAVAEVSNIKEEMYRTVQEISDRLALLQDKYSLELQQARELEHKVVQLCTSRSWRLMRPYRAIGWIARRVGRAFFGERAFRRERRYIPLSSSGD